MTPSTLEESLRHLGLTKRDAHAAGLLLVAGLARQGQPLNDRAKRRLHALATETGWIRGEASRVVLERWMATAPTDEDIEAAALVVRAAVGPKKAVDAEASAILSVILVMAKELLELQGHKPSEWTPLLDKTAPWLGLTPSSQRPHERRDPRSNPPPSPKGLPILGHALRVFPDIIGNLEAIANEYGPIVALRVPGVRAVMVSSPDLVRNVLEAPESFPIGRDRMNFGRWVGESLISTEGAPWKARRRLIHPVFSARHVTTLGKRMAPSIRRLLDRWQHLAKTEEVIDVERELSRWVVELLADLLFSIDLSKSSLREDIVTIVDHIARVARQPLSPPPQVPTPSNLRYKRSLKRLHHVIEARISEVKASPQTEVDITALLLGSRDDDTGATLSEEQVRAEATTLLVLGEGTTAQAASWTLYELARHPRIAESIRKEGHATPPSPTLELALQEAMRLYPPAPIITREASRLSELGGYLTPKGTTILINIWATHRSRDVWKDPTRFEPNRFENGDNPRGAWIPFGMGSHKCVGAALAMAALRDVIPALLDHFEFEVPKGFTPGFSMDLALRPKNGLKLKLIPRALSDG